MPDRMPVKLRLRPTQELRSTRDLPPTPGPTTHLPSGGIPPTGKWALGIAAVTAVIALGTYLSDGGQTQPPATGNEAGFFESFTGAPGSAAMHDGPFHYEFDPDTTLHYGLNAHVQGLGTDDIESSGIALDIAFDFTLTPEPTSMFGNTRLRLDFGTVQMAGTFMGSPVNLLHTPERTQMQLDARTTVDTAQGDSIEGIPQIEFFRDPIYITVTPEGNVTKIEGRPQFEEMLEPAKMVAPVEFALSDMSPGHTWSSEFRMPVPGLGAPAPAKIHNTFIGFEDCGGHPCGVIDQRFLSSESDGQMISPSSIFGEQMGFTMPKFEVTGQNRVYFDTETHNLSRADLDLDFELELGQEFEPAKQLIQTYGKLLNDLEGNNSAGGNDDSNLLNMGVDIKASLVRMD